MPEPSKPVVKKQTSPFVYIGIGCLILIFLLAVGSFVVGKFFAKKFVQGVIENKTGINVSDAEKGKVTFTDPKTGAKVDIGTNKIPDNFPKDFPIYPGTKVTSSLTGTQTGKSDGFWLTLSTTDTFDKVKAYYGSQLQQNGWTAESAAMYTGENTLMETVTKGALTGSLSITGDPKTKETTIVIILGSGSDTPAATPTVTTVTNQGY